MPDTHVIDFVALASRQVPDRSWVFAGFNWPILACRTARALGRQVTEVYEAGVAVDLAPGLVPSSTTDYSAYTAETRWQGSTLDVLALLPRLDAVLLDAADVDLRGRVNAFGAGSPSVPTFRSAGGGGAADAAARARRLVLLHGGSDLTRIRTSVEHITAAPGPHAEVTLVTRWGTARLGDSPHVLEVTDHPDAPDFARHLAGADAPPASSRPCAVTDEERAAAREVLQEAAHRGYRAAARAVEGLPLIRPSSGGLPWLCS